jgi:hypothetical protein
VGGADFRLWPLAAMPLDRVITPAMVPAYMRSTSQRLAGPMARSDWPARPTDGEQLACLQMACVRRGCATRYLIGHSLDVLFIQERTTFQERTTRLDCQILMDLAGLCQEQSHQHRIFLGRVSFEQTFRLFQSRLPYCSDIGVRTARTSVTVSNSGGSAAPPCALPAGLLISNCLGPPIGRHCLPEIRILRVVPMPGNPLSPCTARRGQGTAERPSVKHHCSPCSVPCFEIVLTAPYRDERRNKPRQLMKGRGT